MQTLKENAKNGTNMTETPDDKKNNPQAPGNPPSSVLGPMRLPFLILTPACVSLGATLAYFQGYRISPLQAVLVLGGALAAHISVNALNEYHDFRTGLDMKTSKTPFSGGSGALPANPSKASNGLIVGLAAMAVTATVGIYFLWARGWIILLAGLPGIITVAAYTPLLTKNPFLCLLAPGIGFGPAMVMGTFAALTGEYNLSAFAVSLPPFFLVSNLLLLNQFPDVEADRSVGRRHIPIVWGKKKSSFLYAFMMLGAFGCIFAGYLLDLFPTTVLLSLIMLAPAAVAIRGVYLHAENTKRLIPFMGLNVIIVLATPILVSLGFILG